MKNDLYRSMFLNSRTAIIIQLYEDGLPGRFVEVNDATCELTGYSREELLGMIPMDLDTYTTPLPEDFRGFLKREKPYLIREMVRKDGRRVSIRVDLRLLADQEPPVIVAFLEALPQDGPITDLGRGDQEIVNLILNTVPDTILAFNPYTGTPLRWNNAVLEVTGYTEAELPKLRTPDDWFDGKDLERARTAITNLADLGSLILTLNLVTKDGRRIPCEYTTSTIRDEKGEIRTVVAVGRDISERERQAREVRESAERLKSIYNTSLAAIVTTDPTGTFTSVNNRWLEMTGYTMEEMLRINVMDMTHPDDVAVSRENLAKLSTRSGIPYNLRKRYIRKDGSVFWGELHVNSECDAEGNVIGTNALIIDISDTVQAEQALKESEERYQLALSGADLGTWDWDIVADRVTVNDRWFTMLGYTEDEVQPTSKIWRSLIHPDDYDGIIADLERHLTGETEQYDGEHRLRHNDGHWVWVLTKGKVISRDTDGNPLRMVGTHLDVTERKRLEAQVRQSQKMEAIGTLAGGIAHDFNNILLSIIGNAELAEDLLPASSPVQEYTQEIRTSSRRAAELIKQLLTFSRPSQQPREPVRVTEIINEVLQIARATLPASIQIQQRLNAPDSHILADATELHQVILNLCTNAGQATLEYGGTLTLALDEFELAKDHAAGTDLAPGRYVRLQVSDTGTGIPLEIRERIFEPFFTTRPVGEGSGMGLAVVHGLIKSMKGRIEVSSALGKGTTFTVSLPCVAGVKPAVNEKRSAPLPGNEHILLVDDEPQLIKVISRMLRRAGYEVSAYTDSNLTLQMFQDNPADFDLLITDQTMPGLSGGELAQRVTQLRPGFPVILLTGYSQTMPEEKAAALGISRYVMKPIEFRDLSVVIRELLDK